MTTLLHDEHGLLGASFTEIGEDLHAAERYRNELSLADQLRGCAVCDLSAYAYRYVSGPAARNMLAAITCSPVLEVGKCGFNAILAGDGSLVSVPFILATGDNEFVVIDASPRGEVTQGWLSFVEGIEQGGVKPFSEIDDLAAHTMLVPLLLAGNKADYVLKDYLISVQKPPQPGVVEQLFLDRIPMLVAGIPWSLDVPGYLVLVPADKAQIYWRSLFSFISVSPMGRQSLHELLSKLPFGNALLDTSKVELDAKTLEGWGLLREDRTFIGARSL